jgi:hypothetical protein
MAEDYPTTLMALEQRFSNDAACREYLETLRWPNGFRLPGLWRDEGGADAVRPLALSRL